MSYKLQTDDQILADLASRLDLIRRYKQIKDTELVQRGGTDRHILKKFRGGKGGITLKSFVRLLRGLDELDRLEALLPIPDTYSPTGRAEDIPDHRVRGRKRSATDFTWGEDT
jgi:hypothetical protein